MLKDRYKPLRNLVLIRHEYQVKGIMLVGASQKNSFDKVLDKTVIAVGDDVKSVKPGMVVDVQPNPFLSIVLSFSDNEHDIEKVKAKAVKESKVNPAGVAASNYIIHGYMLMQEADIVAEVNSFNEEAKEPSSPTPIILIN